MAVCLIIIKNIITHKNNGVNCKYMLIIIITQGRSHYIEIYIKKMIYK